MSDMVNYVYDIREWQCANQQPPPLETPLWLTERCKRKYLYSLFVCLFIEYIVIDILCNTAGSGLCGTAVGSSGVRYIYEKQ